jgi:hypothetical protein
MLSSGGDTSFWQELNNCMEIKTKAAHNSRPVSLFINLDFKYLIIQAREDEGKLFLQICYNKKNATGLLC